MKTLFDADEKLYTDIVGILRWKITDYLMFLDDGKWRRVSAVDAETARGWILLGYLREVPQ